MFIFRTSVLKARVIILLVDLFPFEWKTHRTAWQMSFLTGSSGNPRWHKWDRTAATSPSTPVSRTSAGFFRVQVPPPPHLLYSAEMRLWKRVHLVILLSGFPCCSFVISFSTSVSLIPVMAKGAHHSCCRHLVGSSSHRTLTQGLQTKQAGDGGWAGGIAGLCSGPQITDEGRTVSNCENSPWFGFSQPYKWRPVCSLMDDAHQNRRPQSWRVLLKARLIWEDICSNEGHIQPILSYRLQYHTCNEFNHTY